MGAVLITIANSLGVAVIWYCAYDFARHSSLHAYVVFVTAWICFLLPRELGRLAILIFGKYFVSPAVLLMVGCSIMLVLIAIMALVLSPRLAGGQGFMFRELRLSQNTIKGHMHNIYTKTGVHPKQELLDLII